MITLLLLAAVAPQGPASQARLHPPHTVVYAELPDIGGMLDAYSEAPTVQLVNDPEVRAAVSEVLGTVELDLDAILQAIATETGIPAEMLRSPGATLVAGLREVSGGSLSVSLDESEAGELRRTLGKVARCAQELDHLHDALYLFAAENEELFPATLDDLAGELAPDDPWGNPYIYRADPGGTGFELCSLGADGVPGGSNAGRDCEPGASLEAVFLGELERRVGGTLVIEFQSETAAADTYQIVTGLVSKSGLIAGNGDYSPAAGSGVDLRWYRVSATTDVPLWLARSGSHLAMGAGSSGPEAFLRRLSGELTSAADAPPYARMREKFEASEGVPIVQGFLALTDVGRSLLDMKISGVSSGDLAFLAPYLASSWRMGLAGDRFVTEIVGSPGGADGQLAHCFGPEPVPPELWGFIPPDSIAVFATTLDGASLYDTMLDAIGSEPGSEHVPAMLRELEEQHEFSVENDLFGSLGTGAAFYLLPIGSLMSMPGIVGVLELDDSESLQRGLDGLLGLLQQQAGGDFEIKYKPYRDAPLWYFSFTGDSPIPISPSLAIVEDHLLVTLTSVRAKKEIKRVLAGASELHPVMASLTPPPQSANAVGYMDWGSLFEGAYEGGRAVLGFMGGADLPFDVTSLPEAALFTDFYEPTVLWSRLDEDAIYTRVESSFGPETALGLAALGGAAFLGFQAFMEGAHVEQAEEIEAVEADPDELEPDSSGRYPEDATAEAMDFLSTRLAVFRLETGAYPGELAALVEPTENYPRGFLDGGAVPQDGWGRAFVYAVSDDATTYRLWSIGDDGVDQGGEGDDLLHQ